MAIQKEKYWVGGDDHGHLKTKHAGGGGGNGHLKKMYMGRGGRGGREGSWGGGGEE